MRKVAEAKQIADAKAKAELEAKIKADAEASKKANEDKKKAEEEAKAKKLAQIRAEAEQEAKRLADQSRRKINLKNLEKKSQQLDDKALKAKYSKNKTVEFIEKPNRKITRVIINENQKIIIYIKVVYNWGATFYFIQDEYDHFRNISQTYYEIQTS